MLKIEIPKVEFFDEKKNEFITHDSVTLELEHSLVSLSKWESKWEIPFISDEPHSDEQTLDYIRAMTLSPEVSPEVYERLSNENVQEISEYINAKMTATWFSDKPSGPSREIITSEVIYYWMVALNIPFECQYWHLNRLLTLVKVCNAKNQPEKKQNRGDAMAERRRLNEMRKTKYNTSG